MREAWRARRRDRAVHFGAIDAEKCKMMYAPEARKHVHIGAALRVEAVNLPAQLA